jgi:Tfp pilus assembly protein PilO
MINDRLKRQIIYAALAVLLLADATFLYLSMRISEARQNPSQTLVEEEHRLQLMKLDVKRASDIRSKIPQVTAEFDRIEKALPVAGSGYSTIDQELTDYAKDTHLQVGEKKFQEKEIPGRNLSEVTIEATVVGDYSGIVRFLNHLQRSKNTFIVDTLQVDTGNLGQAPAGTLRIGLKILTYFRKA